MEGGGFMGFSMLFVSVVVGYLVWTLVRDVMGGGRDDEA